MPVLREGGLVGRVGVLLAAREREGEIVDWPYDDDPGLEVFTICRCSGSAPSATSQRGR
jgi:hypothetical protein